MEKLADLPKQLHNILVSATAEALWAAFASCAARLGVVRMLIMKGDAPLFTRDLITYTNIPAEDLMPFEATRVGNSPLRRLALRSPEPFLVWNIKHTLDKSRARAWHSQFPQSLADDELFLVPVRREESLVAVAALSGPAMAFDSLTCAILNVAVHAAVFRMEELSAMPRRGERPRLTKRERTCLSLAAAGRSAREIAAQVRISQRTARFHLDNARTKLGVATRALAVRKAIRLGLVKKS